MQLEQSLDWGGTQAGQELLSCLLCLRLSVDVLVRLLAVLSAWGYAKRGVPMDREFSWHAKGATIKAPKL